MKNRRTIWIAGVLSLVALLGVGFLTYFFGGSGKPASGDAVPVIALDKAPLKSYAPTEVLRLRWGRGARDVWVDEKTGWGSTFETFALDDKGRIYIADHPAWHVGARVRRFSANGALEKTWLTPSGSVYFEPLGEGIMFVLARGEGASTEQIIVMRENGSVEGTYAVPAGVNSTALVRAGDTVGVTIQVPDVMLTSQTMRIEERFFPIFRLGTGKPVPVTPSPVPGYGVDTDGHLYVRVRAVKGYTLDDATEQKVELGSGKTVRLPDRSTPVGVNGDTLWFTMPLGRGPDERIERAGWPLGDESEIELLAGRADGTAVARLLVPYPQRLYNARRRLFVTRDAVWSVTADAQGIAIRRYKAVDE